MVLTIGPAVGGAERKKLLASHSVGLLLGATVMAFSLALVAAVAQDPLQQGAPVLMPIAGVVAFGWALEVSTGWGLGFPSSSWQVPVSWRDWLPPQITMLAYGFLLGLGFLTTVVFPIYWLLVAGSLFSHSLLLTLMAWWVYGGTRALSTWRGVSKRYSGTAGKPVVEPPYRALARVISIITLVLLGMWLLSQ
jgi:hypothetical protein